MTRFRAQLVNGWDDPDQVWLREVRRHARFVWIRILGLNEVQPTERLIERWEGAAIRLAGAAGHRGVKAFIVLRFSRRRARWGGLQGKGRMARELWWDCDSIAERVLWWCRTMRAAQPHPVGAFAEDFSARWLRGLTLPPDLLVLDGPMLTAAEADGNPAYHALGYVRRARWSALREFSAWGLPFGPGELLAADRGVPVGLPHGVWGRLRLSELSACVSGRVGEHRRHDGHGRGGEGGDR